MSFWVLLLGAALGAGAVWTFVRRGRAPGLAPGVSPHLLPDPALEWLRRAHGSTGVWVAEMDSREGEPRAERVVDAERLSVAQIVAVDRRLERARDQEQSGAERMEGGTLVFHAAAGVAVGLLLPGSPDAARLDAAESDLRRLADGVRRRPQIVQLVQANTQEASLESVGSVGLRLAYQLERMLDAQVVVAACESGTEGDADGDVGQAVRVIGVSGRGDRRLLDTALPPESDLARVARGEIDALFFEGDPLGGVIADRRQRPAAVLVLPMRAGERSVGAAAIWPPGGREPVGAARAEILAALASAAPRVVTASEADKLKERARLDPLTGLLNRRGLDMVLNRVDVSHGAIIYGDLDNFKRLNDKLGHPAGDSALMHFARIIRDQIRTGDVAARVGGEEFAIWLPTARLEVGYRIAERIRIRLNTTPWDWQGRAWPLSASFGVAACPETSREIGDLIPQADAALYVAKNSGRNRVERAGGR
ncbi:MAG TPA: GGDEF domain-containing protein [Gemmatimonadales bacterium]|nr:GGDEF domain-containing protein [Gemmatimonadales bacterium]